MRTIVFSLFGIVLSIMTLSAQAPISTLNPIQNPTLDELRTTFMNPPREYSTGPLWTWNDLLTEEQVRSTLQDLAGQNVKQVWVHPRPGLMTPYLSDDWFRLWKISLDEAEKLDMNVWIYDENSYPSGFAGGFVPEALPDSRGMGLKFEEVAKLDSIDENTWYVFDPNGKNITAIAKQDGKLPPLENGQKYLLGRVQYTPSNGWFGGKWYVDLLKKGVTEKFIEITHEAYKKHVGEHFGKRIPGIFTDEPHPAGSYVGTWVSWNEEIPQLFEEKFGYSLIDNLPSLHKPVGDWKKVRHNLHALILELFVDRWAKPNFEWCETNNLEWTGHYWEHGWPGTAHCPDNMAMYIWHQRPSIDLLMNTYNDSSPNAQFGNVRAVKELASIANQMGHSRTLSENYGAGGWDLRFEDMKRLGDWSYALGVNTNNEHLSYVTLRGARKRDHPQSFSYHVPWFEGYHIMADYFTRLSYMLSQGRQINRIVVLEPTTTAWMYQGDGKLGAIGQSFTDFVNALEHAQVEYDLASEDTIARFGKVNDELLKIEFHKYHPESHVGREVRSFSIGDAEYHTVILPPHTENINGTTLKLLAEFAEKGGIVSYHDLPTRVDGAEPSGDAIRYLEILKENLSGGEWNERNGLMAFELLDHQPRNQFFHRRQLKDYEIVFMCNTSLEETVIRFAEVFASHRVDEWNLFTGEIKMVPWVNSDTFIRDNKEWKSRQYLFKLPPGGSRLFVISKQEDGMEELRQITRAELGEITGPMLIPPVGITLQPLPFVVLPGSETTVKRLDPNVLTLDYVDVKVGNEEKKDIYAYQADQWIWQKNGFGKNPFDNEVQFKDELITKTFPADSGFSATYRFTLDGFDTLPKPLHFVIERPDLYKVSCNGKSLATPENTGGPTPEFKEWYLDKSFGKFDISEAVKNGDNELTITSSPLTVWTALEPAYLLGDFSLRSAEKGFVVIPPKPLAMKEDETALEERHSDALEGISWLSAGVGFRPNRPNLVDRSPMLTFEFDKEYQIEAIRIWNYCERSLQKRGVKVVEITGQGKIELPVGYGSATEIPFKTPMPLKTVEFKILSNHAGTTYPIPESAKPDDNGFVGLAEVQFLVRDGENLVPVKNVTVKASSELVVDTHDRRARYLVDGSGLGRSAVEQGWHRQGMPFYAGKVEYSRTFNIDKNEGKYYVKLPDSPTGWYGTTARVLVNGTSAGFVVSAPWTVDVTPFIKTGKNEIAVQVYGTPKNLLGPHHAGKVRGSAWPGSFQRGPDKQPTGSAYDVIGCGLFEPFTLSVVQ